MQVHEKALTSVPILTPEGIESGQLYFLPADMGLYPRIVETRSSFLKTLSALLDADILPNGSGADPDSEKILFEAEKQFSDLLNFVCGVETSPAAFREHRPFAKMSDGKFWAQHCMAAFDVALDTVIQNTREIIEKLQKGAKNGRKYKPSRRP